MDEKQLEGVRHLHGSMYLVKFSKLHVPEKNTEKDGKFHFVNPRYLTESGTKVLFDKEESQRLRQSIKEHGLLNPLICRLLDGSPSVCGGQRRYNALDYLIKKKEKVLDTSNPDQNEFKPAQEVYEWILCQIFKADTELEAIQLSRAENSCRKDFSEGTDIALVVELRECNYSDEEILKVVDKQPQWLRDTDKLITDLDQHTLSDLLESRIVRDAAEELIKIEDVEVRTKVREEAAKLAKISYKETYERLQRSLQAAENEEELAEGKVAFAKFTKDGEEEAKENLESAKSRKKQKKEKTDGVRPVTKTKHVRTATKNVTGDDAATKKCLREPKIRKFFLEKLEELENNDGKDPEGTFLVPPIALKLSIKLIKGILDGNVECLNIVKRVVRKSE
jgi:hypothetical protein